MTCSDDLRKRRQRAAYDDYVHLQWLLYRLAHDHPARAALAEAVQAAEQHWRTLMRTLGTASAAPREAIVTVAGMMPPGHDERAMVTLHAD